MNGISEEFYCLTGIYHCITPSCHLKDNDPEYQNRNREDCIRKHVDESHNWLELVDGIIFSAHIAKHFSTKCTPFHMMND